MARLPAAPEFQLLDIPLTSGLSQKTDPRLLPLGQAANVTNVILSKSGSMQKSQGYSNLSTLNPNTGASALAISRISTRNYGLNAVATETALGCSAAWTRDEQGDGLVLSDRVSEVYVPPTDTVIGQSTSPVELDTCVCNVVNAGYELHVGQWADNRIYYAITEPTVEIGTPTISRSYVVPPTEVPSLPLSSGPFTTPKVILCASTTAILTVQQGAVIWATSLNMTRPYLGWSAKAPLVTDCQFHGSYSYGHPAHGVYDTSPVDDDNGVAFLLAYENVTVSSGLVLDIKINSYGVNSLALISSGTLPDTSWTASGNDISAIAVRAAIADGAAWVAYAYSQLGSSAGSPVTAVAAGALVYPGLASTYCTPAIGTDLTNLVNAYPAPQLMDIKKVGTVAGHAETHQVVWSPTTTPNLNASSLPIGAPVLVGASTYNATSNAPCCAIFQAAFYPGGGGVPFTTTEHANQSRWTNNVTLASRMSVVVNAAGTPHAYVAGWIPSNNQIPGATALQDFTVSSPGFGYASSYAVGPSGASVNAADVPTVVFNNAGSGGSGAQATVAVSTTPGSTFGQIVGVNEISGGSQYTSLPTATLTYGTGLVGIVNFDISGNYTNTSISNGGTGYNTAPNSVPLIATGGVGGQAVGWFAYAVVNSSGAITGVSVQGVPAVGPYTGNYNLTIGGTGAGGAIAFTLAKVATQDVQGSLYLFCMDTWADVTATNSSTTNVPMRMCGLWRPRLCKGGMFGNNHVLPHLVLNTNGSATGNLIQTDLPIDVSAQVAVSTICSADFANEYNYQSGELGGLSVFSGGLPCQYDGARTADFAFPYVPENIVATSGAPGSGAIPPGSYDYIAIYTRRDSEGNVHRSGRSVAQTLVLASNATTYNATLQIPTMGFSTAQRGRPTEDVTMGISAQPVEYVEVYRTVNGGSTYYACIPQTTSGQPPNTTFPLNSVTNPWVAFQDNITDADLVNNPLLYGDGLDGIQPNSIIDNLCPPPLQGMVTHKQRFFGYDGNQVWYTKAYTDGEGPGWNELFAFSIDDGPGNITGLATMDERLIIFKRDRIFYVTGDGPADNGTSNDLQPPQRIQSDVGCINWRSIVGTPTGVWFESDNQLYVLSRKMEVSPAGKFVEDLLNVYTDITSATLDMRNGLINWTCVNPSPGEGQPAGIIISLNWVLDAWTSSQYQPARGAAPELLTSTLSGPDLAYTVADGASSLYRQTTGTGPNSYLWGSAYENFVWQSPWIKTPSTQGWLRLEMLNILWQSLDAHALTVGVAYNYANTVSDSWTVGATSQAAVTTPLIQWQMQPTFTQVESFRITISDAADATISPTSGQGPLLIGVQAQYVDQGGPMRFSVNQRGSAP